MTARDRRKPPHAFSATIKRCAVPLSLALALSFAVPATGHAEDIDVVQGRRFAEANCSKCHQIGRYGDSPLPIAPTFRSLHERYPVEDLDEALAEGIMTGHPTMPQFRLDADEIRSLIAYLKTLERPPG